MQKKVVSILLQAFLQKNLDHVSQTFCIIADFLNTLVRCVLIRDLPEESSYDEIRSFFADQVVSEGGSVERIIRISDGYLVAFCNEECKYVF